MTAGQSPSPENFQPATQESIFNLLQSIHQKQPYFIMYHSTSTGDSTDGGYGRFASQNLERQRVRLILTTTPLERSVDGATASIEVGIVSDTGQEVPFSGEVYDFYPTDEGIDLRMFSVKEMYGLEKLKPTEQGRASGTDFFVKSRMRKAEQRRAGVGIVSNQEVIDLNRIIERAYPENRIGVFKRLVAMLTNRQ